MNLEPLRVPEGLEVHILMWKPSYSQGAHNVDLEPLRVPEGLEICTFCASVSLLRVVFCVLLSAGVRGPALGVRRPSAPNLLTSGVWRSEFRARRWTFGVQRLAFDIRQSALGVRRPTFGVRHLTFGPQRSAFGMWRSAFSVRRLAFDMRGLARSVFSVRR